MTSGLAIGIEELCQIHTTKLRWLVGGRLDWRKTCKPDRADPSLLALIVQGTELAGAAAVDCLRIEAKEDGITLRVYAKAYGSLDWVRVGEGTPLTIVEENDAVVMNPAVFGVHVDDLRPPDTYTPLELGGSFF